MKPADVVAQIPQNGVFYFEPAGPAERDIVISCGIHGNETAPIELCLELIKQIQEGQFLPTERVMILFGNLPAMLISERFVDENLNRLFSGAHQSGDTPEHQRAADIEQLISEFFAQGQGTRYHYDLHTAIRDSYYEKFVIYPFTHGEPLSHDQLDFLADSGVDTVLLAHAPTKTLSYYSAHTHGAHAFTVELGKVRPFGENDMSRLADIRRNLTALVCGESPWRQTNAPLRVFQATREILREHEQFELGFADDTPNFSALGLGELLAVDAGKEYRVDCEGEALVFPNAKVQLGHRALLMVRPVEFDELQVK